MTRPPRIADALMRTLLPADAYEAIAGDLNEAWHVGPARRLTYWRLALVSIARVHADRLRPDDPGGLLPHTSNRKGDGPMRSLMQDMAYGCRQFRRAPGFTFAAVATLALGIGATTAIFSMVNILSWKPLPYRDPSRIAFVLGWDLERQANRFNMSLADIADVRRRATTLDAVAAYSYWSANLTGGDRPERVQAYLVTGNTFDLLGVPPLLGRTLRPDDAAAGDVVVISHGLWQRRFAGDPAIVGQEVQVDGRSRTVAGVMPAAFEFPVFNFKGDVWAPASVDANTVLADRGSAPRMTAIARLRDGASYSEVQAEIDTIMRQLEADHPASNRALGARVLEMGALDDEIAGPAMAIVAVTVAIVLLLACANVANLLLARGATRQRELAVRAALGAGRGRIVGQLLVENLLLAAGGGLAGILVAYAALDALRARLPDVVLATQPNIHELGLDRPTLLFATVLTLFTSLAFGLVPACRASRPAVQCALRDGASAGGSTGVRRLRAALVVAEVALSTALLVAAGLLARSYQNLQQVTPGFNARDVLTMAITLPAYRYGDADRVRRFFEEAAERIAQVPSIESAAFVNVLPFSTYNRGTRVIIDGRPLPQVGSEPVVAFRSVTPPYFRTMEIPVVAGRAFEPADRAGGPEVAIVNREFVRQHFEGQEPIGQRLRTAGAPDSAWMTIVGVVGDVYHTQLTDRPEPELYRPFAQAPRAMMMLAARAAGDPMAVVPPVRHAIQSLDPNQPVFQVKTLDSLVAESLAPQTTAASLTALFSLLALVLAAIGTYGVISYAVRQQMREFGIRMALGATPERVLRLVLSRGLLLVLGGTALGLAAAAAVTRLMAGALYGVAATDPPTYMAVAGILLVVGACACGVPAWRATRVEPVAALRVD